MHSDAEEQRKIRRAVAQEGGWDDSALEDEEEGGGDGSYHTVQEDWEMGQVVEQLSNHTTVHEDENGVIIVE